MKLMAFGIYDTAVEAYNQPVFFRTKGEAQRAFLNAINKGQLKETYGYVSIYHLGNYDDATGLLDPLAQPVLIMTGTNAHEIGES